MDVVNNIEQTVKDRLAQIEADKNVTIAFACESGSRVWGFASQNSDYDVRFVYMHPRDKYLSIREWRDVIEVADGDLDFSGWDIRKALRLMNKFNPPIREWFSSPVIYKETMLGASLASFAQTVYSPRACAYHYFHMARGNYRDYLQGERVQTKKYLYVVRPLLAVVHIERFGFPPLHIDELIKAVEIPGPVAVAIDVVLSQKRAGYELDDGPRIGVLNNWIERELTRLSPPDGFSKLSEGGDVRDATDEFFLKAWKANS